MDARAYWNSYVERHGGPTGVSAKLGIPYPTIASVCNGSRGIGRLLAKRMAEADPLLDGRVLVWVEATPKSEQDAA